MLLFYQNKDQKWHSVDISPDNTSSVNIVTITLSILKWWIPETRTMAEISTQRTKILSITDKLITVSISPQFHFRCQIPGLQNCFPMLLVSRCGTCKIVNLNCPYLTLGWISYVLMPTNIFSTNACADLCVLLCQDFITETSYLEEVCELCCSIRVIDIGLIIHANGFDHQLIDLPGEIFWLLFSFSGESSEDLPPRSHSLNMS